MATSFRDKIAENIQNWRDIANHVEKPSDKIRDDFVNEIARFYEDGTEPTRASQDMRYFLHQHEKRLAEKGVKIQRRYEVLEKGVKHTATKSRPPYTVDLSFVECESSTQYSNASSQKILKKHKKSASIFYTNILNRPDIQNAAYTCPNCGHAATLEIFANGCPMCGTRFQMKQLFPCVTNFYLMSQLMGKTNMDDIIKRVRFLAILFGIYVAIYAGVASWSGMDRAWVSVLIGAFAGLAGGGLGFIIIYMIYSIFFAIFAMGKMTVHAVSTADIASAALTKNALSKAMARFDPEFSYELFEGKAMSLFRAIAFSEDRTNMSIYRGDPNIPDIDNLIDIDYRGAMKFLNLTVQNGDDLVLLVRLYMFNTYLINGKIVQRKEDFNMTLVKKLTAKEDYGFSIHAVNCKTCAASFDAMHLLQCPNCGTPYHLENEEWVVMGLKK